MKQSGVSWLGEIPENWQVAPLKTAFTRVKRPTFANAGIVTAFRDGEVTLRSNRRSDGYTEAEDYSGYQRIMPSDLAIHSMDAFAGAIGVSDSDGICSPVLSVCMAKNGNDPRYMAYQLRLMSKRGWIEALSRSVRERTSEFRWAEAGAQKVAVPPIEEQKAIADFLDNELKKIDRLVAEQNKFCATLLEKKDAALAENLARTPNVRKIKLRWVFDFMNGDRGVNYPSPEEIRDDGVPFINAGDLVEGFVSKANLKYVSESKYASMGGAKLTVGDILYCLRGSVGKSAVFNGFEYGTLASSLVALRNKAPRILNTEFAFMLMNSMLERTQRDFFMSGSAQPNLAADALARMEFWIPSLSHQLEILDKMSKLSSEIGALIHRVEESSELLIERRGALISEVVTGNIDVWGKN